MEHPLLGEALPRSSLHPNERAWNLSASLESVPYLSAHRLHGEIVFPGAGYIEMAVAACKQRWPERTVLLEEVSFERVLVLTSESEQQVQVALVEEPPDRATVSIASETKSDWLRHASARVRLAEEQEAHGLPTLDELRQRVVLPCSVATHYQQMRAKGLDHGPAFQGVRELWAGPGEALGRVRLAAELDATGYTVHPACLDACLQVTLAALTHEDTADENWLPVGASSVRIRQPLGEVAWSYVKLRAMDESQPDRRFAQIIVFDESEQVCVELSLELMRVAPLLPRLSEEIGLLARVRAAPAEERRELLVDFLRRGAARILRVAPEQIDGTTLLVDLGIDSLSGIEVQQQLETHLGLKLPAILLWQQLNLIELAEEIDRRLSSGGENAATVPLIEPNVDLLADATLDPNFPAITAHVDPKRVAHPSLLLLTGCTGFLGSFLLHELLTQTEASIVCLVRARDTAHARARIEGSLRGQGLWNEQYSARIRPIVGDLALEHLGLGESAFASLAEELDGIFHNAAPVNWIHPYSHLRKTIVAGTLELLRMAARGRPVPFHFVSTVGASMQFRGYSGLTRRPGGETKDEVMDEDYMRRRWFHMGYLQAKWVADELVGQAQLRGLPASIYRMSFITGHSADGRWHKHNRDFICHLIRGCCALGAAPLQDMVFDMVPVDCVSRSLVELALSPPALGRGFQMTSLAPMHWHQMVETLREAGYMIELLEPQAWIERIREQGLRGRARDLYAMLPHFESCPMERLLGGYEPFRETPRLMTQQSTLRYLKDAQSWSPVVDRRVFRLYLDALVASGFMPPPGKPPSSAQS
jgi:thioester reductase-like protein